MVEGVGSLSGRLVDGQANLCGWNTIAMVLKIREEEARIWQGVLSIIQKNERTEVLSSNSAGPSLQMGSFLWVTIWM